MNPLPASLLGPGTHIFVLLKHQSNAGSRPELGDQANGVLPGVQNRKASASVDGVTRQSGSASAPGRACQNLLRGADPPVSSTCMDIYSTAQALDNCMESSTQSTDSTCLIPQAIQAPMLLEFDSAYQR